MGRSGMVLYGKEIVPGGPWAADDEVRSMAPPLRERRRLMFTWSGLFQRISRDQLQAEIEAIAGAAQVEFIWLFNVGSCATVAFASVRIARAIKATLPKLTRNASLYQGLKISYSSDPSRRASRL
ncbi:hypothetical protein MMC18_007058 [Xylographa bjoerkii]|nr:hypothetical protein [Xylographa bjoerkii]